VLELKTDHSVNMFLQKSLVLIASIKICSTELDLTLVVERAFAIIVFTMTTLMSWGV
jgi:hypothetical protein